MNTDFRPRSLIHDGIKCYPTANYVNYFGMANGYPIKDMTKADSESGYDPRYPWKNRDPRFYKDIYLMAYGVVRLVMVNIANYIPMVRTVKKQTRKKVVLLVI